MSLNNTQGKTLKISLEWQVDTSCLHFTVKLICDVKHSN